MCCSTARKLAGILIEGEGSPRSDRHRRQLREPPAGGGLSGDDLAAAGLAVAPQDCSRRCRRGAAPAGQWDGGAGFAPIRADWLRRAGGLGARSPWRCPTATAAGHFETLDARGGLILRLDDGTRQTITAGDCPFAAAGGLSMAGPQDALVFAPLGGVGEIGMNLAVYGVGEPRRRSG